MIKVNFKKELEAASKGMIMIHDHKLLIKMIIRMIVRKFGVRHAAMLMYDEGRNTYVLNISRGESGIKIPQGYTRFDHDNPLIELFSNADYRPLIQERSAILSNDINKMVWRETVIEENGPNGNGYVKKLLHNVEQQMELLSASVCMPAYYRDKLLAILLLGEKQDQTPYGQDEIDFFAALASDAAMAIRNAQLFESLKEEAERNRNLFLQTVRVLSATIEAKDSYTHGHTERVTNYAVLIARHMQEKAIVEFSEKFLSNLYVSGLLHDIGKIAVPESILCKKGGLTDEEMDVMKTHPVKGAEMVEALNLDQDIIDGILYHHERYDGGGYPEQLKDERIPMTAAIIAVADAFDAMTTDRPYRKGFPIAEAVAEIVKNSGTQFNPVVAKALKELFDEGKI